MNVRKKLNRKTIKRIARLVKLRMNWQYIARAIGVDPHTIINWRREGEKKERGLCRELVDAIDDAKTELYESLADVVVDAATQERVTKTKEIRVVDGRPVMKTTEKIEAPDANLADRLLQRIDPANWADIKRVEIDWKQDLRDQGHEPDSIQKMLKEYIELNVSGNEDIPTV